MIGIGKYKKYENALYDELKKLNLTISNDPKKEITDVVNMVNYKFRNKAPKNKNEQLNEAKEKYISFLKSNGASEHIILFLELEEFTTNSNN